MPEQAERKLTAQLHQTYRVAALGIAMGMSVAEAAAHANVEPDRLAAYQRDPRFQEILREFNTQIEKNVIERVVRRQVRALATMQSKSVDAAEKVISLMEHADRDSVSLQAAKGILRTVGLDLDRVHLGDELDDPEEELQQKDPAFFERQDQTLKELESGKSS